MSRAFLDYVIPWLVDHPDEVVIAESESEEGDIVYELSVHPEDMGKIIGRRGRIIRAIRTLARVGSQGYVSIEVVD